MNMAIVVPDWYSDEEAQQGLIALGIVEDLADEADEGDEGSDEADEADEADEGSDEDWTE